MGYKQRGSVTQGPSSKTYTKTYQRCFENLEIISRQRLVKRDRIAVQIRITVLNNVRNTPKKKQEGWNRFASTGWNSQSIFFFLFPSRLDRTARSFLIILINTHPRQFNEGKLFKLKRHPKFFAHFSSPRQTLPLPLFPPPLQTKYYTKTHSNDTLSTSQLLSLPCLTIRPFFLDQRLHIERLQSGRTIGILGACAYLLKSTNYTM